MARGRQTRRPRPRSLSRETRQKVADAAEQVAQKAEPEPKRESAPPAKKSTSGGGGKS
jgi:hypothetical protein